MTPDTLTPEDVRRCAQALPDSVNDLVVRHRGCVAGGYLRAMIAREKVRDIDLFFDNAERVAAAEAGLLKVADCQRTKHALTGRLPGGHVVQIISGWRFSSAPELVASFDFTIARAAIWWDCGHWESTADADFYRDLAARRLRYGAPEREEEPGGSLMRVLKFAAMGYTIDAAELGRVVARFSLAMPDPDLPGDEEELAERMARVLRDAYGPTA